MSQAPSQILPLIDRVIAHWRRRPSTGDPVGIEIERVLSLLQTIPPVQRDFPKSDHPIIHYADAALQAGNQSTADLLTELRPVIHFLPWRYSYPKRKDAPALEQKIAFAEIIGPEAPIRNDTVCLGFTLIAPHTLYPAHHHPAIELYYVAAGSATWTADGVSHIHPPGSFILHPSSVVHAMETGPEPLLAIYSWSGPDVRTTSIYTRSIPAESLGRTNPSR